MVTVSEIVMMAESKDGATARKAVELMRELKSSGASFKHLAGKHDQKTHGYWHKNGERDSLSRADFIEGITDYEQISGRDFNELVGKSLAKEWHPAQSTLDLINKEERLSQSKEDMVAGFLMKWSSSSGGVVATEIIRGGMEAAGIDSSKLYQNKWMDDHPTVKRDLGELGKIMYQRTQKWFADRGIKKIRLYRQAMGKGGAPFSSWSFRYGGYLSTDMGLKHFSKVIPVDKILSIPSTGFGNIIEGEAVVLGDVASFKHMMGGSREDRHFV